MFSLYEWSDEWRATFLGGLDRSRTGRGTGVRCRAGSVVSLFARARAGDLSGVRIYEHAIETEDYGGFVWVRLQLVSIGQSGKAGRQREPDWAACAYPAVWRCGAGEYVAGTGGAEQSFIGRMVLR